MTHNIARADVIGSLLRPDYLLEAKQEMRQNRLDRDELKRIEDQAILEVIAMQEAAGLPVITDGEYRRNAWISIIPVREDPLYDAPVSGFRFYEADAEWWSLWKDPDDTPVDTETIKEEMELSRHPFICDKLRLNRDIVTDEYAFLKQHAHARAKFNFPSPSWHRIFWHPEYSSDAYPTSDDFIQAMAEFQREHIVEPLLSMGCDYVQMDAPNYSQWHIDARNREVFENSGHDMAHELVADAEFDNMVFAGLGDRITTGIHLCRGNGRVGRYFATGGYEAISGEIFHRLSNINTLLLEYDTARAGGFEPLQDTLQSQVVVLGLVSTKSPVLEEWQVLIDRIYTASKHIPLDRLAISPQCGFASGEVSRSIPQSMQFDKLKLIVEVANEVWGT